MKAFKWAAALLLASEYHQLTQQFFSMFGTRLIYKI